MLTSKADRLQYNQFVRFFCIQLLQVVLAASSDHYVLPAGKTPHWQNKLVLWEGLEQFSFHLHHLWLA